MVGLRRAAGLPRPHRRRREPTPGAVAALPAVSSSGIAIWLILSLKRAIMANTPDETTTINVKSVSSRAWERAKASAIKQGETMGTWLGRAIDQLATAEAGPREFPPANPAVNLSAKSGNPGPANPLAAEDIAAVMQGVASLAAATGIKPSVSTVRQLYAAADDIARDERGIPRKPRTIGKALGQSLLGNGKAAPRFAAPAEDDSPPA